MKKYWRLFNLVLIVFATSSQIVSAQEGNQIEIEELVVSAIDDEINIEIEDYSNGVSVPEELLRQRFAKLQNIIPFVYHSSTHRFVDHFITRNPSFTKRMMAKQSLYLPIFEKHLKKYGLPVELKYLSMIESGLDPRILSRVGAGGLWQFMPATGREFGLFQDKYIDERFDPEKATIAACRYMKQLYRIFGDWELVLASYNTGPGNLRRAMRRSGGHTFWTVYDMLPKETRSYVPQFVAITYLMHYGHDHGVYPDHTEYPVPVDTILINGGLNLEKFATYSGVTLEEIARLNPQLLRTEIPAYVKNFPLKVPSEKYSYVVDNRQSIWDSCFQLAKPVGDMLAVVDSIRLDTINNRVALSFEALKPAGESKEVDFSDETSIQRNMSSSSTSISRATHVVKRGETLSTVARKHKVSVANLRAWNGLKAKSSLKAGQRLVINKATARQEAASGSRSLIAAVKEEATQATVGSKVSTENRIAARAAVAEPSREEFSTKKVTTTSVTRATHVVKKGETLSVIAKNHKVAIADLRKWNSLGTKSALKVGQKLAVHKTVTTITSPEKTASKVEIAESKQVTENQETEQKPTPKTIKTEELKNTVHTVLTHTVQKGETLSTIARKHKVTIADLQKWNALGTKSSLSIGQKLAVNATKSSVIEERNTSKTQVAEVKEVIEKEVEGLGKATEASTEEVKVATVSKKSTAVTPQVRYHTVQKGDTLWLISQKYGLTIDKLKKVNQIKGNNLRLGQKLLING